MMKKVWLVLLAVVLVFGLALVGCGSKSSGSTDPDDPDENLEDTLVYDMATNTGILAIGTGIKGLTPGPLTISDSGEPNPIKPLVKAGNNTEHVTGWTAVANGDSIALQYKTNATWGVGVDLRYADFGFREGDEITVTGEVVSITGSAGKVHLNGKVGNNNPVIIGGSEDLSGAVGEFTLTGKLTADDIKNIKGGDPAAVRLETRASGVTMKITNITVSGLRPSNLSPLAAPVVTATETGVSWVAIENAGGYKVYAGETLIGTLAASETSINIFNIDEDDLAPGPYSITVVALGVSGSSKDSPASTAVSFTKEAQPVYKFNVKVGTDQEVQVKGVSGGIEVLTDKSGFTFTKDTAYQGSYAWFYVDLGTKKISAYEKVTLTYQGVSGSDIGYKNISLIASATKPKGTLTTSNPINAQWWNDYNKAFEPGPQVNGTAATNTQFIIAKEKADTYTDSKLYFVVYFPSNSGSKFTLSAIEFVEGAGAVAKDTATLDGISVKTNPTKVQYDVGDTFDPAGLEITTKMVYGTTGTGFAGEVPYNATDFSFTSSVSLTTAFAADADLTVTVTYKTKTATFKIRVGDYVPDAFDLATGMTTGIEGQGSANFADGIIDLTGSGSALFILTLPSATSASGTKVIKIKYICRVEAGDPKVTLKNGAWGDIATGNGTDGCNWYPTLTALAETTLELKEAWYTDATAKISFQRNGDTNFFKIKIISITLE